MIRRISDSHVLPNEELNKIAEIVAKNDNKELFDIAKDEDQVELMKKELRMKGFQVQVEPYGDKYKVFAITPPRIQLKSAMESGSFKKLAWGRYCFQRESAIGMFKYDFDDGSIWKVMKDEASGEEYLVKEIDEEDDNNVLRTKTAFNNSGSFVNDKNVKTVASIIYDINDQNNSLVGDLIQSDIKNQFYNILNEKIANLIKNEIEQNHFINSPEFLNDVTNIIKTAADGGKLNNKKQLSQLIIDYSNTVISKTGKIDKIF